MTSTKFWALFGTIWVVASSALMTATFLPARHNITATYQPPDRSLIRAEVELVIGQRLSERMARDWYPELTQPHSALAESYQAAVQSMRDSDDVELDDPDYPMDLAIREADRLGIKPSKPLVITHQ